LLCDVYSQVNVTDPITITISAFSLPSAMRADPLRESISLELDVINIFVRMVQILAMQQNRKK
jgi:FtsH-binding integral membrane protein